MEGSAIGTPAYMSPEQACGDLESMGARSDVYSLGATLYSLLTGKPPFSGDVADALRAVQKSDFLPPRRRDPSIARGLEAACLKAMALRAENRYNSARALAEDIERWMADEPMLALREGWIARARRWSRKHRTAVAALAGLFIAATIGLAIGTVLITREWKETQVQRNIAQAQGRVAQTQRNEAEAQGRQARQAVRLLTRVAEIGFDEQLDPLQKQFLENALAYYEQFTGRGVDDPGVTLEHGLAYQQMGAIQRKLGRFGESERAFRMRLLCSNRLPAIGRPAVTPVRWPGPERCWRTCWCGGATARARPNRFTRRREGISRHSPTTPRPRPMIAGGWPRRTRARPVSCG